MPSKLHVCRLDQMAPQAAGLATHAFGLLLAFSQKSLFLVSVADSCEFSTKIFLKRKM